MESKCVFVKNGRVKSRSEKEGYGWYNTGFSLLQASRSPPNLHEF